jgi:hypothetical protein
MRQPRAVRFTSSGGTVRVLHIETAGAIVDIRLGLHDTGGNESPPSRSSRTRAGPSTGTPSAGLFGPRSRTDIPSAAEIASRPLKPRAGTKARGLLVHYAG